MKIGVFADIHSNYHGFRACYNEAVKRGVNQFLFLGDYVSDCAYPEKTMELLYHIRDRYPCTFIRGNREDYLLNHQKGAEDGWITPSSATGGLLYTYEHMTKEDLEFFEGMRISGRMQMKGYPEFQFCHGTMDNTKGVFHLGSESEKEVLEKLDTDLIISGHTHRQGIYKYKGKTHVNAGSVGVPWDYNGDAQFCILHGENGQWMAELIQLDYDKALAVKELYDSHLNEKARIWTKLVEKTLLTGRDYSRVCLTAALEKWERNGGKGSWYILPEQYWEEAADEMGL
ncbi:metallophosphoesterase family protein [Lacrimispora amygdalina]|uniref:metallophosphoesterase family protein n=1 Tax=Lacrimispora amygdalina TaxID=253257 RepID=UPI000BE2A115|nr:metallophosphoesterase family protein [Lacrimispora amygdalina]